MELKLWPEAASAYAHDVDQLTLFLIAVSGVAAFAIILTLAIFAVRYRRSARVDRTIRGEHFLKIEIAWTLIPLAIFLFIFAWGAKLYLREVEPPADSMEIFGVAKQWMWKFQHPEGNREINELHVPIGRPVKVVLASEDVIHSFYVPAFRVKMDVVPGRYTRAWFQATKPGTYHLFCAEYCGTGHSKMIGRVVVMTPSDFEAWLSGGAGEEPLATRGHRLFDSLGCKTCHEPEANLEVAVRGPMLSDLFGKKVKLADGSEIVADEDYIRESILRPQAKIVAGYKPLMPTYEGQLDENGLAAVVAFIKSSLASDPSAAR